MSQDNEPSINQAESWPRFQHYLGVLAEVNHRHCQMSILYFFVFKHQMKKHHLITISKEAHFVHFLKEQSSVPSCTKVNQVWNWVPASNYQSYYEMVASPHTDYKKNTHSSGFHSARSSAHSRALLGQPHVFPPRASTGPPPQNPRRVSWRKHHMGNPGAV